MVSTYIDSALKLLDWLEKNGSLSSPLKDQVLTLKQKSRFLRTYLICSRMSNATTFASSSVTSNVELEAAFKTATDELSSVCLLPLDFEKVDTAVSYMLENVKVCEPEIRKSYAILVEQPPHPLKTNRRLKTNSRLICASYMSFIDSILENLEELLGSESLASTMKITVEILNEKLSYLRNFFGIIAKRPIIHKKMEAFLRHIHISATRAACFSFMCWDSQSDEVMASGIVDKLSDLLQKIKPFTSDLMEIFIELLKASISAGSKTTKTDEIASFISLLLENKVESLKDRIASIHEELVYLIAFLMDLPADKCTGDLETISADVKVAAKEAALFQVHKIKEEQVNEMSLVISRLLQKMKLIKEEILRLRIIYNEDALTALHRGLNFLRSFPIDLHEEKEEDGKLLSKHVQTVASEVTSLIYSIHCNKKTYVEKLELDMLLQKIKLIKGELYLMHWQNHTANLVSPMKYQIGNLQEGLLFLRTFLMESMDTTDRESNIQDGELFLAHLKSVINESFSLSFLCGCSEITEKMANELNLSIFRLLGKIKLIKAEVILLELIKFLEFGLIVHMKDEVETLQVGVRFLRAFLMIPPKAEGELIFAKSEATANEAASLIFSLHYYARKENMAFVSEMNHSLSELVAKIKLLKAEIKDTYFQVPYSDMHQLPEHSTLNFLLVAIKRLNLEAGSLALVKHQTEMFVGEFASLISILEQNPVCYFHNGHQQLKDFEACVIDVSWKTECVIDLTKNRDESVWYLLLYISFAMEDIKRIKAKFMEIFDERSSNIEAHSVPPAPSPSGSSDVIRYLTEELTGKSKKTDIVSIIGMSGIGKTTLAKTVYKQLSVVKHFPIRAWFCVSQKYQMRELLLGILHDITAVTNSMYEMSDDELVGELRKHLMQKRYLIVLDDVWDPEVLDYFRRNFPDNDSGSRILLTSRMDDMAVRADSTILPYFMLRLSQDECWQLFQKNLSDGETLDSSFECVGKEIMKQCPRLPLAVLLMAGFLSHTEREVSCWMEVAKSLRLEIEDCPLGLLHGVLTFVYKRLPDHMKPCFLCFGKFPVGKEIHARKLFDLWIEKGLIPETDSKTLEKVAEERLLSLASRNLVSVSRRRYDGSVRACRLHDVVGELCIWMQKCTLFT